LIVRDSILDALVDNLFSTPAPIPRAGRGKLPKTALAHTDETRKPLHFGIMKALSEAGTLHE